jgi:kexin
VVVTATNHRRGDLRFVLTSPSGSESVFESRSQDSSSHGFSSWPFFSVAHWGESPIGTWTLKMEDVGSGTDSGQLVSWQLVLRGFKK